MAYYIRQQSRNMSMIDWRIVLGAFLGGLALTCWLESRRRLMQPPIQPVNWWQGTAVFTALLSLGLFIHASLVPFWQVGSQPKSLRETAVLSPNASPPLPPPSIFTLSTPPHPLTPTPPHPLTPSPLLPFTPSSLPLTLQIPSLRITQPIVQIPLENGRWDVSQLGSQVGLLAGTGAHPGDTLAPVFAGHMTFPTAAALETGAFADLQVVTYGTEIILRATTETFHYTVSEISRVAPSEVERLYLADGNSILLVTCTDWDENGRFYTNRLLVRAILQRNNG